MEKDNFLERIQALEMENERLRKSEEMLRKRERKYRTIIESVEEGYFEVDLTGTLIFANPSMAKIAGAASVAELMGMNNREYTTPEVAKKMYQVFNEIHRTGRPMNIVDFEIIRRDNVRVVLELSISLIRDDTSKAVGFRGLVRDVTAKTKAQEDLKQAKKEVEAASQAKSQFLANMSHEIRTPMNGIIGMTTLLLDTPQDHEQTEYTKTIQYCADSLLTIINDILDFSKIEAGMLELEILEFDFRTTVEDACEMLAIQAHTKGLEFVLFIHPDIPPIIKGDPARLSQIIINLVNNAIKFTDAGEVLVQVKKIAETENRIIVKFSVIDTGIGIPEHKLDRLFRSFSQVNASTTRKHGGTGLGLVISKQLVELMGGQIGIKSGEGRGTTFWFTIDFEKKVGVSQQNPFLSEHLRKKRFMIVDDNKINLEVIAGYLKSWGLRYNVSDNASDAIQLLKTAVNEEDPYDLVIIDHSMPETDGADLGKMIMAHSELKKIKMVMLTSSGIRGDAKRMKAIGFSAYISKPIKRSQLFDCIVSCLDVHSNSVTMDPSPKFTSTKGIPIQYAQRHVRILLVEDNIVNQKLGLRLLGKMGYICDCAANGREALRVLEMAPYDLVLMDIQMPVMDGLEATRQIRRKTSKVKNHDVPIIAMTAHAMKEDRGRCVNAGMDDYVSKPIKPERLAKAIERCLSAKERKTEDA